MSEKTEKQKMLAGEFYLADDVELTNDNKRASLLLKQYNSTTVEDTEMRLRILKELFGKVEEKIQIVPPFHCDYGSNIYVGDDFYMNFGCVILDCAAVHIGNNVLCAPGAHIYTASHPTDPEIRRSGLELAAPVKIGNNVWLGGGAIVCPGVTIGDDTTIGAGSVVVKDIPARVVAAGNPCVVIRHLA